MKIVETIERMGTLSNILKKERKSIGLVPTMGYLHEGHLSLVRTAKKHNDAVVISVFVNPAQFCPGEDLDKYPRDFKRDEQLSRSAGADILFYPSAADMYPEGYRTYVEVEGLTKGLCGAKRPGHFRGVATVVTKLFNIVRPDMAYFGQKDAQQAVVIQKMAADLNMGIDIKVLPTVREKDGLAMSSRNAYLSEDERKDAAALYRSLAKAESMIKGGETDAGRVIKAVGQVLSSAPSARIEYVSVVDADTLEDVGTISGRTLIAIAAYIGRTRLIDNIVVNV